MTSRRLAARTASAILFLLLLLQNRPSELLRRARVLRSTSSRELALRRLAGSGVAFDREYFVFLESVRRLVPPGTPGVAISVREPTTSALYLASYVLAPVPVLLSPRQVPPRWIAAVYGPERPEGWREIAAIPGGALYARP
ncbi:MAG TPA: hypothetical protein VGA31_02790 [Thermoanaerobaculia bacterium]